MIEGENCDECCAVLDTERRWSINIETQKCIWDSRNSVPVVDMQMAQGLGYYCSESHAMKSVNSYLMQVGAVAIWSDVRPIETCACCNNDFATTDWHKVLSLLIERGPLHDIETLQAEYVARFCQKCVPLDLQSE